MYQSALASVFGARTSAVFMAVTICLFAYTSVVAGQSTAAAAPRYISGERGPLSTVFCSRASVYVDVLCQPKGAWQIADLINALMSLPNLASLLMLAPVAGKISRKIDT